LKVNGDVKQDRIVLPFWVEGQVIPGDGVHRKSKSGEDMSNLPAFPAVVPSMLGF
jgi:hypothetical protein